MLQVEISLRKWFGGTAHLRTFTGSQGRNQLFISGGGNFHEISFDDVIVIIQPFNRGTTFSQTVTDKVLFAAFPKKRTFQFLSRCRPNIRTE